MEMSEELRTMFHNFFSDMRGQLVQEVRRSLEDDASEVTFAIPREQYVDRRASTPISTDDGASYASIVSADIHKLGARTITLANGDSILVPLECETLYKENLSPESKQIKPITLTAVQLDKFTTKTDILSWFKDHYVPYYRYGGQKHLVHMIDSASLEQIKALLRSKLEWMETTPQELMDEVYRCAWEVPQSAHDYRVALRTITFNTLVSDIRFDFDAIIFSTAVSKLLTKSAVKYSKSAASHVLAQIKEPLLVKHLNERIDLIDSFEEFWIDYTDRVAKLEEASKIMELKHSKKQATGKVDSRATKPTCEICSQEGHYATNTDGTVVRCPAALAKPDVFKSKADAALTTRAKKFAAATAAPNAESNKKHYKPKTGSAKAVISIPVEGVAGGLSEQLFSATPKVTLTFHNLMGWSFLPFWMVDQSPM